MDTNVMQEFMSMNMNKIEKWSMALLTLLILVNAVLFISMQNWSAMIWMITTLIVLYCFYQALDLFQQDQNATLRYITTLEDSYTASVLRETERKEEIARANANYFLKKVVALKNENAQLKILNKNLLEHQKTKNNYGRNNTYKRATKKRNTRNYKK